MGGDEEDTCLSYRGRDGLWGTKPHSDPRIRDLPRGSISIFSLKFILNTILRPKLSKTGSSP